MSRWVAGLRVLPCVGRWRQGLVGAATVAPVWLALATNVWAQEFGEEPEEKGYVPSYMIIFFAVGLALLMICRAGKRSTGFRREE